MAQIKKRFIAPNAIDGSKIQMLNGEALRATNGGGQSVPLFSYDGDNVLRFALLPEVPVNPTSDGQVARKGYVDQKVLDEAGARISADAAEATARAQGDAGLQSQLDAEKARIDAILAASQADKDSFAEIVALINSVDTENDSAFASYVLSNNAALAQEVSDRQAAVSAEESARISADSAEQSARQSADAGLQSQIDALTIAASGDVSAEVAARTAADAALAARLDVLEGADSVEGSVAKAKKDAKDYAANLSAAETSQRIAAVGNLQYQIANILENTDPAALDSLAEVVSAFQAADGNLNNAISALGTSSSSALAAETQARQQADSAEASARQAADAAEASARQAADAAETAAREASLPRHAKHASTLGAGESYKDLSHKAVDESLNVFIDRLALHANDDYTVSTSPSGHTRITFTGSFMSSEEGPAAGDLFRCSYAYKNSDQPAVPPPGGAGGGVGPGAGGSSADDAWAALGQWTVGQTGPQQVQIVRAMMPAGAEPTSPMGYLVELYDEASPVFPVTGIKSPIASRPYMLAQAMGPAKVWSFDFSANPPVGQLQAGHTYRARLVKTTSGTTMVVVQDFAGFTA
jgi:hypothetical protein